MRELKQTEVQEVSGGLFGLFSLFGRRSSCGYSRRSYGCHSFGHHYARRSYGCRTIKYSRCGNGEAL